MAKPIVSVDEIVATLRRSKLSTVVTEGNDDTIIFRRLESRLEDIGVSLLPAGGRDKLLEIFRRRSEFANTKTAFIADLDLWVFGDGVPKEFQHASLLFTDGYSIENDMYRDGDLEAFLLATERTRFRAELAEISPWFSAAVAQIIYRNTEAKLDMHPHLLLDSAGVLKVEYSQPADPQTIEIKALVDADYSKLLRGKTLMALLLRQLSRQTRSPKHSRLSLLEAGAARRGPFMNRFETFIRGCCA